VRGFRGVIGFRGVFRESIDKIERSENNKSSEGE
jgi:hypothetical protein